MVANKSDLYENEEVDERSGKQLSLSMKALFHSTSAKISTGIEDLFYFAGLQFIDPAFNRESNQEQSMMTIKYKSHFKLEKKDKKHKQSKSCC